MDTRVLAGAIVGFLLGGLTVSVAAELEDEPAPPPSHGAPPPASDGGHAGPTAH